MTPMHLSVNAWDLALWVVAAYVAVTALVRLMAYERDHLILRFRAQVARRRRRHAHFALARKRDASQGETGPAERPGAVR
jgi:hypothetical protein